MPYAIPCYHDGKVVSAWSKGEDDAVLRAAEGRRMPGARATEPYGLEGPDGLLGLEAPFGGRRQWPTST